MVNIPPLRFITYSLTLSVNYYSNTQIGIIQRHPGRTLHFYINRTTHSSPTLAITSGDHAASRSFGKCTESCLRTHSPACMSIDRRSWPRVSIPHPLAVEKKVL